MPPSKTNIKALPLLVHLCFGMDAETHLRYTPPGELSAHPTPEAGFPDRTSKKNLLPLEGEPWEDPHLKINEIHHGTP